MLLIYVILFFVSILFYKLKLNFIAFLIMVSLSIFLYVIEYRKEKRIINVRGLFAIGFIAPFGVSLLKLSNLSNVYSLLTIVSVFSAYFAFYFGAFITKKKKRTILKTSKVIIKEKVKNGIFNNQDKFLLIMIILVLISFMVEAFVLKFIPLFTINTPHAYSTFHIFGVHYITTLYVFFPSIAICNYYKSEKTKKDKKFIIISYVYVLVFALLMVSRAQLIISFVLSLITYVIINNEMLIQKISDIIKKIIDEKNIELKFKIIFRYIIRVAVVFIIFIIIYVVITIFRAHDIKYLNSIFDMKDKNTPIFISQPYMYIAHNFENLNYMINNVFRLTFGRRTLAPFFTLTLIKKFFPIVVDSPYYIIKDELSTTTLIYDFYYDFGIAGVILFCFILGFVGKKLEDFVYDNIDKYKKNNYIIILLSLFCFYMTFSFFQAYFSLTNTWVNIIFILIISFMIKMNVCRVEIQKKRTNQNFVRVKTKEHKTKDNKIKDNKIKENHTSEEVVSRKKIENFDDGYIENLDDGIEDLDKDIEDYSETKFNE